MKSWGWISFLPHPSQVLGPPLELFIFHFSPHAGHLYFAVCENFIIIKLIIKTSLLQGDQTMPKSWAIYWARPGGGGIPASQIVLVATNNLVETRVTYSFLAFAEVVRLNLLFATVFASLWPSSGVLHPPLCSTCWAFIFCSLWEFHREEWHLTGWSVRITCNNYYVIASLMRNYHTIGFD